MGSGDFGWISVGCDWVLMDFNAFGGFWFGVWWGLGGMLHASHKIPNM